MTLRKVVYVKVKVYCSDPKRELLSRGFFSPFLLPEKDWRQPVDYILSRFYFVRSNREMEG